MLSRTLLQLWPRYVSLGTPPANHVMELDTHGEQTAVKMLWIEAKMDMFSSNTFIKIINVYYKNALLKLQTCA